MSADDIGAIVSAAAKLGSDELLKRLAEVPGIPNELRPIVVAIGQLAIAKVLAELHTHRAIVRAPVMEVVLKDHGE